ncbi:hypothetical protein [Streptomyces sp. NPDC051776]|uniref:hypothetical protein n=1 Tax=Streptomyces sp. NPDC051776 TaxID=3155414 RepID=UPI00344119E2
MPGNLAITRRGALRAAAAVAVAAGTGGALAGTASGVRPRATVSPDPRMSEWYVKNEHVWDNEDYSEELQGITAGTEYWYIANNSDDSSEGIWRVTHDFGRRTLMIMNPARDHHLGDIGFDFARNRIYAALEPAKVWETAVGGAQAATVRIVPLGGNGPRPQGDSMPWCAVNPRDGLLYSSAFGDSGQSIPQMTQVHAYDPADGFRLVRTVALPHAIRRVQGGAFSPLGRLYVSSDASKDVRGYALPSAGGGPATYLGSCGLNAPDLEVEGLVVGYPKNHATQAGGHMWVHAVCLDNDWPSGDDAYVKHISVPDAMTV